MFKGSGAVSVWFTDEQIASAEEIDLRRSDVSVRRRYPSSHTVEDRGFAALTWHGDSFF
jgi:hypothetical protein